MTPGYVPDHVTQAFRLSGGVLISVPQDQLSEEMEQLVLSTRHLRGLLDDFSSRQPIRRLSKVVKEYTCSSPFVILLGSVRNVELNTNTSFVCCVKYKLHTSVRTPRLQTLLLLPFQTRLAAARSRVLLLVHQVIRATLPIVRSLVGQGYESEARILALNQLFELTQVRFILRLFREFVRARAFKKQTEVGIPFASGLSPL